jgi:hypothetical protein
VVWYSIKDKEGGKGRGEEKMLPFSLCRAVDSRSREVFGKREREVGFQSMHEHAVGFVAVVATLPPLAVAPLEPQA